jgi:hypothetical protein
MLRDLHAAQDAMGMRLEELGALAAGARGGGAGAAAAGAGA